MAPGDSDVRLVQQACPKSHARRQSHATEYVAFGAVLLQAVCTAHLSLCAALHSTPWGLSSVVPLYKRHTSPGALPLSPALLSVRQTHRRRRAIARMLTCCCLAVPNTLAPKGPGTQPAGAPQCALLARLAQLELQYGFAHVVPCAPPDTPTSLAHLSVPQLGLLCALSIPPVVRLSCLTSQPRSAAGPGPATAGVMKQFLPSHTYTTMQARSIRRSG